MRKFLFIFLLFLFPISVFASGDYSKDSACKLKDGVYKKNLLVTYPGASSTTVSNFIKSGTTLYYIVNIFGYSTSNIEKELYFFDCKTKKAQLLSKVTLWEFDETTAEIDYFNKDYIFIQYIWDYFDGEGPSSESVYLRWEKLLKEFKFSNNDELIKQYVQDYGSINDTPFIIKDVTIGKDKNLLVWITWGYQEGSMLRALSVNPKTFYASNVLYDYTFKKLDNTDAWLKIKSKKLFEKSNAGGWFEIKNVDLTTFRAIQWNYGRDKNGYTQLNASKNLPKDAISKSYHLWFSPSQWKIYSYNLWDWTSVLVKDPASIFFHYYFEFNDPNTSCIDTTGSYWYVAEDNSVCYGNIAWSNADFGIVGKIK